MSRHREPAAQQPRFGRISKVIVGGGDYEYWELDLSEALAGVRAKCHEGQGQAVQAGEIMDQAIAAGLEAIKALGKVNVEKALSAKPIPGTRGYRL